MRRGRRLAPLPLLPPPAAALDPEQLTSREVPIAALQARMDAAIDNEEYEEAAALRDEIQ